MTFFLSGASVQGCSIFRIIFEPTHELLAPRRFSIVTGLWTCFWRLFSLDVGTIIVQSDWIVFYPSNEVIIWSNCWCTRKVNLTIDVDGYVLHIIFWNGHKRKLNRSQIEGFCGKILRKEYPWVILRFRRIPCFGWIWALILVSVPTEKFSLQLYIVCRDLLD